MRGRQSAWVDLEEEDHSRGERLKTDLLKQSGRLLPFLLVGVLGGGWITLSYSSEPPLVPLTDTLLDRFADRIPNAADSQFPLATPPPPAEALMPFDGVGSVGWMKISGSGQGASPSTLDPAENLGAIGASTPIRSRMLPATKLTAEEVPPISPRR